MGGGIRYVVFTVGMTCVVGCGGIAPDGASPARPSYAVDARGRAAMVAERITLRWPAGMPIGMIQDVVVCESRAYVYASLGSGGVDVVDLERGDRVGQIGRRGGGPGEFFEMRDVAAGACGEERLYVVDGLHGVLVFDRTDGRWVKTYPLPDGLSPSFGNSSVFVAADGGLLYVAGLWTIGDRHAYARKPKERMYEASMLLWRLSLADGEGARMVSPVTPGCFGDGATCASVVLDRVGDDGWVIAQAGGTRAAMLSADAGRVLRVFDVRSPRFLRDDAVVIWGEGVETSVAWGETNSTIHGVYAHGDVIAVVHSYHATRNWRPGDAHMQFHVFMNLYATTGEALVSDVRLPDLVVGRDEGHLLVTDYGEAGRRGDADQVDLLKIPMDPDLYQP